MASVIITRCHNEGSVSGAGNVRGVCGENSAAAGSSGKISSADIQYCYNIGIVSGTGTVGGVCGVNNSSSSSGGTANAKINRCYDNSDKYSGTAVSNNNCTNTEGRTTAQFKSGEVAYLLQQGEPFSKWGQTIGTDDYPFIGGPTVYYIQTKCTGEMVYSNQDGDVDHCYINKNCIGCGAYQVELQEAPKNGDVYEISNADQLYWFAALVNGTLTDGTSQNIAANAKLMADIVVNKNVLNENGELNHTTFTSWTPIGYFNSIYDNAPYSGTFDGIGHTISGLYYNDSNGTHVGLFGVTDCGTLNNIGVVDSNFNGKNLVGGISGDIIGSLYGNGIIVNCYFIGSISGTGDSVGGLCGTISDANITNCYYDSDKYSGNAVGTKFSSTVTNVEGKTTEQFKSGEVAYLLSQGCTIDGTFYDGSAWGQQLGVDNNPVHAKPGINKVYEVDVFCDDVYLHKGYYNSDKKITYDHITSTNDITFDSGKKIYSHSCQREGCGKVLYFADAAGSIAATPNADETAFTIPSYTLTDATAYDSQAEFTATSLAYKRTFSNGHWQAVYVPFEIDCGKLPEDMEMAVVNNFHEYEQEDGSYNVVLEVKRKTSGTIPALTPCVIRMKTAPKSATEKEINLTNVPFSAAEDKYIDCASVLRYYKFNGSLAGISAGNMVDGTDFVLDQGTLYKANAETTLKPQRWFLSSTDRSGGSSPQASMLRSISISVVGDEDVTGIEDIHVVTENVALLRQGIFDMQGRRLDSVPTHGIYIKNGIKYVK